MSEIFLGFLNRAYGASWLILAILLLRLLLKNAPKRVRPVLWGLVGLRLLLPQSIKSQFSLVPSGTLISSQAVRYDPAPAVTTGIPALNRAIDAALAEKSAATAANSVNPMYVWTTVAGVIWLLGVGVMLLYLLFSYLRLRRRVAVCVCVGGNVFQSDAVSSPFVMGLFRPRIYLPSEMDEATAASVLAHERAHISRGDHLVKFIGFLLLALYWFHPLVWLGYILLCRDLELACDERVIKSLDAPARAAYSQALLSCSAPHRFFTACPIAFGEVGVKTRIKAILNYKKPAFWLIVAAIAACIAAAVCFLTDPKDNIVYGLSNGRYVADDSRLNYVDVSFDLPEGRFRLTPDVFSSTLIEGTFEIDDGKVICTEESVKGTYIFKIIDNDTISFTARGSSELLARGSDTSLIKLANGTEFHFVPPSYSGLNAVVREIDVDAGTVTVSDADTDANIFGAETVLSCANAELLFCDYESGAVQPFVLSDLRVGDTLSISLDAENYDRLRQNIGAADAYSVQLTTQVWPRSAITQMFDPLPDAQFPDPALTDENGFVFTSLNPNAAAFYPYRLDAAAGSTIGANVNCLPRAQEEANMLVVMLVELSRNSGPTVGDYAVCSGGRTEFGFTIEDAGSYYLFLRAAPENTTNLDFDLDLVFDGVSLTPIASE